MSGEKPTKKSKEMLIILDFDGSIFFNPKSIFSLDIPLGDVLRANPFFSEFTYQSGVLVPENAEFALITSRSKVQEAFILNLLRAFGYKIDLSYFSQMERTSGISENEFLIRYWAEKVKLIDKIRESGEYGSIVVIDDDIIICYMLRKLGFEVYRTKITRQDLNQPLSVSFSRLSGSRTAKLQGLYEQHQNREFIAKGVLS